MTVAVLAQLQAIVDGPAPGDLGSFLGSAQRELGFLTLAGLSLVSFSLLYTLCQAAYGSALNNRARSLVADIYEPVNLAQ